MDARTTSLAGGAIPDPASVAAPPGTHNMPRRPTRVFVGRASALDQLSRALADDANAVVAQAIYGLGGVGKTELALHYADVCRAGYRSYGGSAPRTRRGCRRGWRGSRPGCAGR